MEKIRIKYFSEDIEKLTYIDGKSDWIDLRAANESRRVLFDTSRDCHGAAKRL